MKDSFVLVPNPHYPYNSGFIRFIKQPGFLEKLSKIHPNWDGLPQHWQSDLSALVDMPEVIIDISERAEDRDFWKVALGGIKNFKFQVRFTHRSKFPQGTHNTGKNLRILIYDHSEESYVGPEVEGQYYRFFTSRAIQEEVLGWVKD